MFYLAVSIQMLPPQHGVPYAIVPVSKQVGKGFPVCICFLYLGRWGAAVQCHLLLIGPAEEDSNEIIKALN